MSTHSMKTPASEEQLAYIKRLQIKLGQDAGHTEKDMDKTQASMLIGKLVAKAHKNSRINGPRLEMAMRECFKKWTRFGTDVWRQHREDFIKEVIDT